MFENESTSLIIARKKRRPIFKMPEVNDLLASLVSRLPSPNSRLAYIRDIKQFQSWCYDQKIQKVLELKETEAFSFYQHLNEKFKDSTIARKITSVRSLFKEAQTIKLIKKDPFEKIVIDSTKIAKKKVRPLDVSEIERVLLFPRIQTEEGLRDYVLLYLLFSLGLKIGEVTSIHYQDFKPYEDGVLLYIRKPRQKKGYYSKVSTNTQKVVNEFIKKYHITGFLFTSLAKNKARKPEKEPLTARSGWVIVKKYLKLARLSRDRTTNCAREFFMQYLLDEDVSPDTLRRVTGLGSLNAMRRYGVSDLEKAKSLLTFKNHPVDKIRIAIREH